MKKILAIGNSFSEDATKYVYDIAKAAGIDVKVVNLYIGGCSLERHWTNIEENKGEYKYQLNGVITERYTSIEEVLMEDDWDYIITQQASHDSGWVDTYEPFLGLMVQYLKEKAPKAEVLLMETWAYEVDSRHWNYMRYNRNQAYMYERLKKSYYDMAEKYGLRLIKCGDIIQAIRGKEPFVVQNGGTSLCRDGFHMSLLYGRYILAAVWMKTLFGIKMTENDYVPSSLGSKDTADTKLMKVLRQYIDEAFDIV